MSVRKSISLPAEMWRAIADYRFRNRFSTEAEAVRALLERGLRDAGN